MLADQLYSSSTLLDFFSCISKYLKYHNHSHCRKFKSSSVCLTSLCMKSLTSSSSNPRQTERDLLALMFHHVDMTFIPLGVYRKPERAWEQCCCACTPHHICLQLQHRRKREGLKASISRRLRNVLHHYTEVWLLFYLPWSLLGVRFKPGHRKYL